MKTIQEQFADVLKSLRGVEWGQALDIVTNELAKKVQERDAYVIGEDEVETTGKDGWKYMPEQKPRNQLKAEQRKRAEETL